MTSVYKTWTLTFDITPHSFGRKKFRPILRIGNDSYLDRHPGVYFTSGYDYSLYIHSSACYNTDPSFSKGIDRIDTKWKQFEKHSVKISTTSIGYGKYQENKMTVWLDDDVFGSWDIHLCEVDYKVPIWVSEKNSSS